MAKRKTGANASQPARVISLPAAEAATPLPLAKTSSVNPPQRNVGMLTISVLLFALWVVFLATVAFSD